MIRDPRTKKEISPSAQPGYYPGFSTLSQKAYWDEATQKTIEQRVSTSSELRFFTPAEALTLQAALSVILPQSDRDEAHQIPILHMIDQRLHSRKFDGYIFENTVEDDEAHRLGISALEAVANKRHGKSFHTLSDRELELIMLDLQKNKILPGWNCSEKVSPEHYFHTLLQNAISAYYSHPYAWDEIGFGGPAYPRGYMRLVNGTPEPWEKEEKRYEWLAPEGTHSDQYRENNELFSQSKKNASSGTH